MLQKPLSGGDSVLNSGISKLVVRWDKCLNQGGDHVEK
jgi:hypothetical protein